MIHLSHKGCGPFDVTNASKHSFSRFSIKIKKEKERFQTFVVSNGPQPKSNPKDILKLHTIAVARVILSMY